MQQFPECSYAIGPCGYSTIVRRMVRRATRPGSETSLECLSKNFSLQTKFCKATVHIPRSRINVQFSHDHPFLHVFIHRLRTLVKHNPYAWPPKKAYADGLTSVLGMTIRNSSRVDHQW